MPIYPNHPPLELEHAIETLESIELLRGGNLLAPERALLERYSPTYQEDPMITIARLAVEYGTASVDDVPAWQWAVPGGWWQELSRICPDRREPALERRPVNGLNVEIGTPQDRCMKRCPDGRGAVWLLSGGSILQYGRCCQKHCPRARQ